MEPDLPTIEIGCFVSHPRAPGGAFFNCNRGPTVAFMVPRSNGLMANRRHS